MLVIAFAVGILSGILPYFHPYLRAVRAMSFSDTALWTSFRTLLALAINPLILFIASFRLGRKLDVRVELRTTIISIYLGCFIGSFVGWQLGYSIMIHLIHAPYNVLYNILWGAFTNLGSAISLFFVSFSAISIAHFLKHQAKLNNETSDNHRLS